MTNSITATDILRDAVGRVAEDLPALLAGLDAEQKLTAQQIVARVSARTPPQRGTVVKLNTVEAETMHVFSEKTQERLSA